jgi:hypothetical protein
MRTAAVAFGLTLLVTFVPYDVSCALPSGGSA